MGNCSVLRPYRSKIFEDKVVKYKKIQQRRTTLTRKLADMAKIWPKNGQAWSDMAGVLDIFGRHATPRGYLWIKWTPRAVPKYVKLLEPWSMMTRRGESCPQVKFSVPI